MRITLRRATLAIALADLTLFGCYACDGRPTPARDAAPDASSADAAPDASAEDLPPPPTADGEAFLELLPKPAQLVLDGDHLYWVNESTKQILRMPKTGGKPQVIAERPARSLDRVYFSVVGDDVFFSGSEDVSEHARRTLWRAPKTGEGPTEVAISPSDAAPATLGSFQGRVYWFDVRGFVVRSLSVNDLSDIRTHGAGVLDVAGFAFDPPHVYWLERSAGRDAPTISGSVRRAKIDEEGSGELVFDGRENPKSLTFHNGVLYWIEGYRTSKNRLFAWNVNGPKEAQELAALARPASGLTTDGVHLYWGSFRGQDDKIFRMPLAGGAVEEIAQFQYFTSGIAVDDNYVYWTNLWGPGSTEANGSLRRLPKP